MAVPNEVNSQVHGAMLNGVPGRWVPVDANEVRGPVSNDPNNPTANNGAYYYQATNNAVPTPIQANMNNAIPTPSSIVQLPPIVQPIAMVPYTTQNQPLVQYDPNYRPPVRQVPDPTPAYKRKPYSAISALVALLAVAVVVVACLAAIYNNMSLVKGIMTAVEDGSIQALFEGDTTGLITLLVPVLFGVAAALSVVVLIYALIKLGKMQPMAKFNVLTLIALLFAIAGNVLMIIKKDMFTVGLGAYVVAGILLVMLILPLFINKKAMVVDYVASKNTFTVD